MAMIINTNVAALNAQRNLSNTSGSMGKTLEKLSSGLRINRAGDDAAAVCRDGDSVHDVFLSTCFE